jgi:hypothetical protein
MWMWSLVPTWGAGWPLGLTGMLEDRTMTIEERLRQVEDAVRDWCDCHDELSRQAMYQYLYTLGHRIPTGAFHANLAAIARRTQPDAT